RTSTLTKRLAHTSDGGGDDSGAGRSKRGGNGAGDGSGSGDGRGGRGGRAGGRPSGQSQGGAGSGPAAPQTPPTPPTPPPSPRVDEETLDQPLAGADFEHAPDEAEEGGIARAPKPDRSSKPRRSKGRHGRRR